jgi:hypothetical protein
MITCKICGECFEHLISSTHLKKHNIKTKEYKAQYGDVSTAEYRAKLSEKRKGELNPNFGNKMNSAAKERIASANKGKEAWNKGKSLSESTKAAISTANKGKEAWNKGVPHTNETINKIKEQRKLQTVSSESAKKAVATKKAKGYNFAVFEGKQHTDTSKQKISESSKIANRKKSIESLNSAINRIRADGYSLDGHSQQYCDILHDTCGTTFRITRQYLSKSKYRADLCPVCFPRESTVSKLENELACFLSQHTTVIRNDRKTLSPLELDILMPDIGIAVEFNGLYWHSEQYKDSTYHIDKSQKCMQQGITLIHVFEDEWVHNKDIVKSRLLSYLKRNQRIYARKCTVASITPAEANAFVKKHHLQGSGRANCHYGLYYNSELVAVMTFLKGDISKSITSWELNRYCSKTGFNITGGASKLFKQFIRDVNPAEVISYADLRWSYNSEFYTKLGFLHVRNTQVNYWYIPQNEVRRIHRYQLKKPAGSAVSERDLRLQEGYLRIYDCGSAKYVWSQKSSD